MRLQGGLQFHLLYWLEIVGNCRFNSLKQWLKVGAEERPGSGLEGVACSLRIVF